MSGMKVNHFNQQLVLARQVGCACGKGELPEFALPNVEKAWNEYRTYIKTEAWTRGWNRYSDDEIERYFRLGYKQAVDDKRAQS